MRSLLPAPAWVHTFVEDSLAAVRDGGGVLPKDAACPRCQAPLDINGYRRTQTAYLTEEVLRCQTCTGELLLFREERV